MSNDTLDVIGQFFWYGMFATPVIAFFIVRKLSFTSAGKIAIGIFIAAVLAVAFCFVALNILLRDGLGF